jgi:hypothetical protein
MGLWVHLAFMAGLSLLIAVGVKAVAALPSSLISSCHSWSIISDPLL